MLILLRLLWIGTICCSTVFFILSNSLPFAFVCRKSFNILFSIDHYLIMTTYLFVMLVFSCSMNFLLLEVMSVSGQAARSWRFSHESSVQVSLQRCHVVPVPPCCSSALNVFQWVPPSDVKAVSLAKQLSILS